MLRIPYAITFLVSILTSLFSFSQTITDAADEDDISEIILNYHEHGIKHFLIISQNSFNRKKYKKHKFEYTFLNDTLLEHTYNKTKVYFSLKDSTFTYVESERDKLLNGKYIENEEVYYSINEDSANVNKFKQFHIVDEDTIFYFSLETIIINDSSFERIATYIVDSVTHKNKSIVEHLLGDTIHRLEYKYTGNNYFLPMILKKKRVIRVQTINK